MKKIKITKEQAKMLKEMSKKPQTRVLKITQEQYDKIVQSERAMIDEKQNISTATKMRKNFNNSTTRETKNFMKTIKETYNDFISELYSLKEGGGVYENLIKLMEIAGMVENRRIKKEAFLNDSNVVKEVISHALQEISNGASDYQVMEMMEGKLAEVTASAGSGQYTGLFPSIEPINASNVPEELVNIQKEEELEEAATAGSVGGQYDTPGFAASEFMGTKGKKGKAPVNKGITHKQTTFKGGSFVKVKKKCNKYPYCNQGAGAITLSKSSK
jgi:ABC-type Fe3+/spermidine/putrescine transport system ATPase subunit